ncbi:MAG TPA: serine/threonine-protein kinase, partial [Nannocystis sp.]
MKRCPACGTVYSVAQGFCPEDGAPLADDAPTGAPASASMSGGAVVKGTWDPPRAGVSNSEMFVMPSQPRAVSASTGPGASTGNFVIPPLGSPGMTANGFMMPPVSRPTTTGVAAAAVAISEPDPDPADTSTAFIPPITGAAKRTVVAMIPPGARSAGERLASLDAPRAGASGPTESAPGSGSSGASGLAQVPASAAVPGGADSGAFFPPGGLSRARPEAPAPSTWEESLIGRVLDQRYRIEGCIGAGGMGVVYKATHVIIDKPLAIKMLRADVASQPDVVKRFLLEAQLASKVKHPNVVDISDYGQIAGQTAYYVMEYLSGETLAHRVDTRGRLDPALAVDIALQTAHALQAAHACKIIHRDLKAENIFLCDRPGGGVQAKILDFGIARIRDKRTRLTAMGALIGTPAYMSPEQAQGSEVDERTDLYALGVILFEMLAGRVPFKAATVALVLSAQIFEAPPSLQDIDPGVPDLPNLEHVLQRLLAKNRDERPDDAGEVIHLLKTAAEIDLGGHASGSAAATQTNKRRATVTIGSWSVAENPSGMHRSDNSPSVAGEARATPRPEADALVVRPFTNSGRLQRRPSVIVPAGTHVERIAAPPVRPPITGEMEGRHYPTGVNPTIPQAGPPMILIIAAAASIGAAITVT